MTTSEHLRNVIGNDGTVELHFPQRLHRLVHIHVSIVYQGFGADVRQRTRNVSEMDLEQLVTLPEIANGPGTSTPIPTSPPSSQQPIQRHTPMFGLSAISIARLYVEGAEDASRDTSQGVDGWVIRMNADVDTGFFGNRRYPPNHVLVVLP